MTQHNTTQHNNTHQAEAVDEADEWALCEATRADVEAAEEEARARDRMSLAGHLAAKKAEKEVTLDV